MHILSASCFVFAVATSSCAKKHAPPAVETTPSVAGTVPQAPREETPAGRRQRNAEATLYVDGRPVAVMRAAELPPGLKTHALKRSSGPEAQRYLVSEYLASQKIDLAKVRAVHFYGGSRVVVVDGNEARKHAHDLAFDFTHGDRGKVKMHFPRGIAVRTTIDLMNKMVVYVEKEPPTLHETDSGSFLAFADGKRIDGVPYADRDEVKGTRVYVDGVLVTTLKRRRLSSSLVVSGEGESAVSSFDKLLAASISESDLAHARAVDLLSDDDLVGRLDALAWNEQRARMTFTLPQRSRGLLTMDIPGASGRKARISAVQIFVKTDPPPRFVAPVDVVALPDDERAAAVPPGTLVGAAETSKESPRRSP